MVVVARIVVFVVGVGLVMGTLGSAVRTVVLPRAVPAKLASAVFVTVRRFFALRLGRNSSYERRDRVMAPYGPTSLLILALVWLIVTLAGYTAMFWAVGHPSLRESFITSGSSLLTLGFVRPPDMPSVVLAITEAVLGLTLLALLITYLPSLYSTFSRREAAVARLEVRAGSPPFGAEMIERYARIDWLGGLGAIWDTWEGWFVELEESHTSFPALVFFRSPQPDHSWITAAGAVLDAAALMSSTLEENDPDADLSCGPATWPCAASPTSSTSPTTATPHPTTPYRSPGRSTTPPTTGWPPPASPSSPTGTRPGGRSQGGA